MPWAVACACFLAACGGGGGGDTAVGGGTEQAQGNGTEVVPPTDTGESTGPTPQEGPDAFYFKPTSALAEAGAIDQIAGGKAFFAAWNPKAENALAPGMKVMFFGAAQGCAAGTQGPLAAPSDARLTAVAGLTALPALNAVPALRWTPAGDVAGCDANAQSRAGASAAYLNADDSAGAVGLLTTSGVQDDGASPFFGAYGTTGQDGAGTNAYIAGTFVNFRQVWWTQDPLQPWTGSASARVRSVQSIGDLRVETVSSATQQAKQQMVATFFNPTCRKLLPGQPCQVQYLFNTAIARRAVTDWSKVSWFQHGSVWFDPVQGGIPIVDGPIAAPGGLTTDGDAGLALFGSQGSATQHAAFNGRTFDVTISFDQLGNALRLITAKANKITLADVTDAQVDAMWGTSRSDRNAWVLLSADVGQEVYNPDALTKVQVAGGFTSLYVGPQP